MKYKILTLLLLSFSTKLFSQNLDSATTQNSENQIATEQPNELNSEENIQKQKIFRKYNITGKNKITAKMLGAGSLRFGPESDASRMNFEIPANEIVYAIKYMPEQRCWLVNYQEYWGFIEDYLIMAIKEDASFSYKDQWDKPPAIKTKISPVYPDEVPGIRKEGNVEVKIFIDEKGNVTETIIMNGIEGLNDAAINAINKARFEPAVKDGKKVGVWVPMRINFKL
ncbi:MAG: energy transducer TonB [Bacteroidales bacterium]